MKGFYYVRIMRLEKRSLDNNEELLSKLKDFQINKKLLNYIIDCGYKTEQEIEDFLNPTSKQFYDSFLFEDMAAVVEKINSAVANNKRILIFGDYDVDGIGATAIMVKYFESINYNVSYYLPSRYEDGYGLSKESIDKVNALFSPDLIITVDCGITSKEEVEYIKSLGKDVIVTDHHDVIAESVPDCLVVNPKHSKTYPFKGLCGAGVALKVVCALTNFEECRKYFTICAISTIADLMELVDENRYIVKTGLKEFYTYCPIGVMSLAKACGIEGEVFSKDIGFYLAPKLNAAGRMGDAMLALKLYLSQDESEIFELTASLLKLNTERQKLCNDIFAECDNESLKNKKIIIVAGEKWEGGMLGIVAARFTSKYNVPAIVLTFDEKEEAYVGSARSVEGVNIHTLLNEVSSLLVTFGGHSMAAGLTIKKENLCEFINRVEQCVGAVEFCEHHYFDIELSPSEVNYTLVNDLEKLEPFGQGFARPVFNLTFNNCNASVMKNYQSNVNILFENFSCIGFKKSDYLNVLNSGLTKHIICDIYKEKYKGRTYVKALIDEIDYECDYELKEEIVAYNLSYGMSEIEKGYLIDREKVKSLSQNTLFICNTYQDYLNFNCENGYYFTALTNCVIAPKTFEFSDKFENIVFLSKPLSNEFVNQVVKRNKANVYVVDNELDLSIFSGLKASRSEFMLYYKLMLNDKTYVSKEICYEDIKTKQTSFSQFVFCVLTFIELGLISVSEKEFKLVVTGNKGELENSKLYKFIASLN